MSAAEDNLKRFVALWTSEAYPPRPTTGEDLDRTERRLQFAFPADYRQAVTKVGLPRPTAALLDAIVDRNLPVADIGDFLDPEEIVATTESWRELGLSDNLVTFATDGMGSLFCFSSSGGQSVWFFDHDETSAERIAESFTDWLHGYCMLSAS